MERFTYIFWMLQGFNVMYDASVFTTTLWAQWICNLMVQEGKMEKLNKNYHQYIGK